MKVLVTGANGFLGRRVVAAASAAGHEVVAMVRPTSAAPHYGATIVRGDLRQRGPWTSELDDVDAVIHLAAATSGELSEQFAGTVVATENLLDALALDQLTRFVHISTIAVYDFAGVAEDGTIDESTPIESAPARRDPYTETKLIQESLVRAACDSSGTDLVVLRPGAVYGPAKDWSFGVATHLGPFALVLSPGATPPLTHVRNCADAIVRAVDAPAAPGETLNVVDDPLPTYAAFERAGRSRGMVRGVRVGVPWRIVDSIGRTLDLVDRGLADGQMKVPEVLAHRRQQARWKPLRYSNERARETLGWTASVTLDEALDEIAGADA